MKVQEALNNTLVMLDALTVEFGITGLEPLIAECKSALADIEKCEPDFIVKVWHDEKGKYCRNQEFVNIPEADGVYNYYTSPQPRDWVELTNADLKDLALNTTNPDEWAKAIGAKLKQLNTKG